MSTFWTTFEETEAVIAAAKAEALRAERESAMLKRLGPEVTSRICCTLKFAHEHETCDGPCAVLVGFY